jgi:hypothetical protein
VSKIGSQDTVRASVRESQGSGAGAGRARTDDCQGTSLSGRRCTHTPRNGLFSLRNHWSTGPEWTRERRSTSPQNVVPVRKSICQKGAAGVGQSLFLIRSNSLRLSHASWPPPLQEGATMRVLKDYGAKGSITASTPCATCMLPLLMSTADRMTFAFLKSGA